MADKGDSSDAQAVFMSVWRNLCPLIFVTVHPMSIGVWVIHVIDCYCPGILWGSFLAMYMWDFLQYYLVYRSCSNQSVADLLAMTSCWVAFGGRGWCGGTSQMVHWAPTSLVLGLMHVCFRKSSVFYITCCTWCESIFTVWLFWSDFLWFWRGYTLLSGYNLLFCKCHWCVMRQGCHGCGGCLPRAPSNWWWLVFFV